MKEKLIIVTGNQLKFQQLLFVLQDHFECEQGIFKTYEIQGTSEEILEDKLLRAYEYFKAPVLVEDTALHLEALGGFPGPYMRDLLRCMSAYDIGKKFVGTCVSVVSRLGLMKDSQHVIVGIGTVEGVVADPTVKDPGIREFDNFVQPDGLDRPLIAFTPEETLAYSHRGKALYDLLKKL